MCGILGAFGAGFRSVKDALPSIRHRGPDGERYWEDRNSQVALGHQRLAILDLTDAASQPMLSPDGQVALVFNGELYNFHEVRQELEAGGATFRGTGDTEILLQGYLKWGEDVLSRLR